VCARCVYVYAGKVVMFTILTNRPSRMPPWAMSRTKRMNATVLHDDEYDETSSVFDKDDYYRSPRMCPVCESVERLVCHHDHFRSWCITVINEERERLIEQRGGSLDLFR
jgi:hypothetical protein